MPHTKSHLLETVTITFICPNCGKESVNEGVKRSPLPQWGLKCSHCSGQCGIVPYQQFDEWQVRRT